MTIVERIEEIIENEDYGNSVKVHKINKLVKGFCDTLVGDDKELKSAKETTFTDKDYAQNKLRERQRKILRSEFGK